MKSTISIKPLSVNEVWAGRRFKTPAYTKYEKMVLVMLPTGKLPPPPYQINFVFALSNVMNDIDNSIKPFTDILQKKYNFNDRHIMRMEIEKTMVKKGDEYIFFEILPYLKKA